MSFTRFESDNEAIKEFPGNSSTFVFISNIKFIDDIILFVR